MIYPRRRKVKKCPSGLKEWHGKCRLPDIIHDVESTLVINKQSFDNNNNNVNKQLLHNHHKIVDITLIILLSILMFLIFVLILIKIKRQLCKPASTKNVEQIKTISGDIANGSIIPIENK